MKNALLLVILMFFSYIPKAEAVLCVVQTSDPRYNVASYIRNQTSCKTTQYANPVNISGKLIVTLIAVNLLIKLVNHIREEDRKEKFISSLSTDPEAKVYQCYGTESIDVITANGKAYSGMNGEFFEMDRYSPTAYRKTVEQGIIQFDLDRNMMMVQRWTEKTAKGGRCEYKGLLSELS